MKGDNAARLHEALSVGGANGNKSTRETPVPDGVLTITPDVPEASDWRTRKSPMDVQCSSESVLYDDDEGARRNGPSRAPTGLGRAPSGPLPRPLASGALAGAQGAYLADGIIECDAPCAPTLPPLAVGAVRGPPTCSGPVAPGSLRRVGFFFGPGAPCRAFGPGRAPPFPGPGVWRGAAAVGLPAPGTLSTAAPRRRPIPWR